MRHLIQLNLKKPLCEFAGIHKALVSVIFELHYRLELIWELGKIWKSRPHLQRLWFNWWGNSLSIRIFQNFLGDSNIEQLWESFNYPTIESMILDFSLESDLTSDIMWATPLSSMVPYYLFTKVGAYTLPKNLPLKAYYSRALKSLWIMEKHLTVFQK